MSTTHPRKIHRHLIFVEDPHPSSYTSLMLLNKHLHKQTKDYLFYWLKYRKKYLSKHYRKNNTLRCEYCGKTGLKIQTKNRSMLATIDHKVPLSKNGINTTRKILPNCCKNAMGF